MNNCENNKSGFVFPKVFFVAGTDTGVGKTVVSAILAHALSAHYWKPIQSGIEADSSNPGGTDSKWILQSGIPAERVPSETYVFNQPLSPHLSSRLEGKTIDLSEIKIPRIEQFSHLIVEGAGGLLVPLNDDTKIIDLIAALKIPVLLVARSALGTINHTLLSLEALRARQIPELGVIMTGKPNYENRRAIEKFGKTTVLAEVPPLPDFSKATLLNCFNEQFLQGKREHENERKQDMASVHTDAYCGSST